MRLEEFADAEEQIKLWKLISDSVWHRKKCSIASLLRMQLDFPSNDLRVFILFL